MDRKVKKDKLLHANLPTQHPSRADSQTHIRATTHSRSAESEVATSTPRPPPLIPAPAARPPPRRPAQAARPPPLMPAPAATSVRSTTVQKCMPPVLFKKPHPPSEGLMRAKKIITLQRPINETVISKISLEGSKSVNLNAESNKNFNIKSARLNDLLSNLQKKSYNQEEMKQFHKDQEEIRQFHENKKAGSLSFSIDSLLSPDKKSRDSNNPNFEKLRNEKRNVRYCPESSNNAALPANSSKSSNVLCTTQDGEESHNFQTLTTKQNDSRNYQFKHNANGPISAKLHTLYDESAIILPAISHESANHFSENNKSYDERRRRDRPKLYGESANILHQLSLDSAKPCLQKNESYEECRRKKIYDENIVLNSTKQL